VKYVSEMLNDINQRIVDKLGSVGVVKFLYYSDNCPGETHRY